jgi:hypothetical protein
MLFLADCGLDFPEFPKFQKKYLETHDEAVNTALGGRLEGHEASHVAKFRVRRFKDGGDMKFRIFRFSKNPLRGFAPQ